MTSISSRSLIQKKPLLHITVANLFSYFLYCFELSHFLVIEWLGWFVVLVQTCQLAHFLILRYPGVALAQADMAYIYLAGRPPKINLTVLNSHIVQHDNT